MQTAQLSPVDVQILWSRLIHIADECWTTIWNTAFSTVIGEALDFGVEILDPRGESLAHAPKSMPVFHFCLPNTVRHLLERFPATELQPGDVLVTNDPWVCAGHLPDIATVSPVFHRGRLVAILGSVGNACDIGGTKNNGAARELYEEGLFIPPLRLYRAGEPVREIFEIIASNVRMPEMVIGDIEAQIAANRVGEARLVQLLDEYGIADLETLATEIKGRAEEAMRRALLAVPDGTYRATTRADGVEDPLTLKVAITIDGDSAHVDYDGAPPQVAFGGINCPRAYTVSHTLYAMKLLLTPEVPSNAGNFVPFTVAVPEGSVLACSRPASVALRTRTGWHLHELIFQALAPALPDCVQAGSGLAFSLSVSGVDQRARPFADHLFVAGGQGASKGSDGTSALLFPTSAANVSVEMLEQRLPLLVEEKTFAPGSAGTGAYHGGFGERLVLRRNPDDPDARVALSAFPEGLRAVPPGLAGGAPGSAALLSVNGERLERGRLVHLHGNDRFAVEIPGGGGWGKAAERDPQRIHADQREGFDL